MTWGQTAFSPSAVLVDQVIRRFCECGVHNRCSCGRPPRVTGWTVAKLAELRELMRDHGSVAIAAARIDETVHECNRALNALLGRTPAHALAALEAAKARS